MPCRGLLRQANLLLMAVDQAQVGEAVDEELHGERDEEQAHDTDENADAGFAEEDTNAVSAGEDQVAHEGGYGDRAENRQHLPVVGSLADEDHDAGDGAGSGQHGNAQGDDPGVFFGGGLLGFVLGFLGGRAASFHHVDTDQEKDEAAGDLEGGKLNAEERKDELAGEGEGDQDDEAGDSGFTGHAAAALQLDAGGDGDEGRDRGKGVDEEKDGAEGQEGKPDIARVERFLSGGRGRNERGKLLNQMGLEEHVLQVIAAF